MIAKGDIRYSKMRTALTLGRLCIRQKPHRLVASIARHQRHSSFPTTWRVFHKPPKPPKGRILIWSLLSPAAFVALSEEDSGDGKTPEEHMLEASRAEIAKEIPEDVHGLRRAWRAVYLFVDTWIFEPIATTFRFLHLVMIFVPVIGTMPLVWLGKRQRNHYNERSGTLWWYSFLVRSMERAGPAFIKVSLMLPTGQGFQADLCMSSLVNGQLHEQTSFPKKCAISCPPSTPTLQRTP